MSAHSRHETGHVQSDLCITPVFVIDVCNPDFITGCHRSILEGDAIDILAPGTNVEDSSQSGPGHICIYERHVVLGIAASYELSVSRRMGDQNVILTLQTETVILSRYSRKGHRIQ